MNDVIRIAIASIVGGIAGGIIGSCVWATVWDIIDARRDRQAQP